MPLNKSLFEKNIAGNESASSFGNNSSSSGLNYGGSAPRKKWGKSAATSNGTVAASEPPNPSPNPKKPKWGGSHLKGSTTSTTSGHQSYNLKKTPANSRAPPANQNQPETVNLKKVEKDENGSERSLGEEVEEPIETPTKEKETFSDINSTLTESTADLTEKMEASEEIKLQEPCHDWAATAAPTSTKDKKLSKKEKKEKKNDKGSPFALDEKEYLKEVPPQLRTKGSFDWSGVDSVIASINFDKKIDKKRQKLLEKLQNINATREDALKMMRDHVQEQKRRLDESKDKVRKKMYETTAGMSYNEMVQKVKENNEIVATLKKSNNKLRIDTQKMTSQVQNLRLNNTKLEAANEQSNAVLEQLKERKKSVDARYEHLTKVIIPPYRERIKEMQEVLEERKLYGRNENRTKIRYANFIIQFLDKVDRSDETEKFKELIWELGKDVVGGQLADLEDDNSDNDDDIQVEDIPVPSGMNESFSVGDMTNPKKDQEEDNNNASITNGKDKSLWDRYGTSQSVDMDASKGNTSSSNLVGSNRKHSDLLQKANAAKAKNFNGAVILSDSSESGSDSDSDSDSVSLSSDDS